MCLGVPGQVIDLYEDDGLLMGKVAFGGVAKHVCLEHTRDVAVGEYVLVHVGFALTRLDAEEAERVFSLLRELDALDELEAPQ